MNIKIKNRFYSVLSILLIGILVLLYWPSSTFLYSDEKCCPPEKSKTGKKKERNANKSNKKNILKIKPQLEHKHEDGEHGDFCKEHNVSESECGICRPDHVNELEIGHGLKIRMGSKNSANKAGVKTTKPVFRMPMMGIKLQGKITYNKYKLAHITSITSGVIGRVLVKNGEYVRKGQKLLEINSNKVVSAKEVYLNALTDEQIKKSNFIREQKLRDKQISSVQEYEQAMVQYRKAKQKKLSSRQKLINLGLSKNQLKKLEITQTPTPVLPIVAPFDGTVVSHSAVRGEGKAIGEKLMTLTDLSEFWLEISIPEIHLKKVRLKTKIKVMLDLLPGLNLECQLNWISSEIHPQTRTIKALATLKNPQGVLKHGMYASVFLQPTGTQKLLTVPTKSLHYFSKQPFLFVKLDEDLYEIRRVSIGTVQAEEVEILKGIKSSELIASKRSFILKSELLKSRLGAGCVDD